jgi:hypothetical protein
VDSYEMLNLPHVPAERLVLFFNDLTTISTEESTNYKSVMGQKRTLRLPASAVILYSLIS